MKDIHGADLNENLCCSLCKSYLIDAVTLTECLHSYCRACLLGNIEKAEVYHCTKCAASFGKDLSEAFVRDDTLQKLVYKMVPEVYWQELLQRGEFLKKRIVSPDEKATILDKKLMQLASELCAPNEMVSLCLEYVSPGVSDNDIGEDNNDKEAVSASRLLDDNKPSTVAEADRLEKQEAMLTTFRRYFRCQASTRIGALRKLLEAKLEVSDTYRLFFVDSDCNVTLDDQCTLQDIAYMFSWRRLGPMKILFTLQRHLEEEKPPVLDMEFMPELVAEEPLSQGNAAVTAAIETPVQLPALTVSLNTSMMEGGPNHQPIITTEIHPPPRKKRKSTAPTKKQAASPVPVQRMTGVSPLAKGPPPLVRLENSGLNKKTNSNGRIKAAEKTSSKTPLHEDTPATKQAKLMPTSFDNKLQQIIDSSPSRSAKIPKGNKTKTLPKTASSDVTESSSKVVSNDKPADSSSKNGNTNSNLQTVKLISTDGIKTESGSSNVKTENVTAKEKTLSKLHTISKITENTTVITTISTPASTAATTTAIISHPRPIQPRPMEMKTNYEALVKSYGLNGMGNKLSSFPLDGKNVGFSPPMHMQPPLFMDPKIAAQPIKHILSGRAMPPIVPETTPYLRNPALANFMHHLHMQPPPIPGLPGSSTPPLLSHNSGSTSSCSSSNQLTSSVHNPPISNVSAKNSQQPAALKHPAAVPLPPTATNSSGSSNSSSNNSSSSNKLLNSSGSSSRASSPAAAKLQQKIVSPIPIPTAHITPFMSHS